jgi:hypothetical protein
MLFIIEDGFVDIVRENIYANVLTIRFSARAALKKLASNTGARIVRVPDQHYPWILHVPSDNLGLNFNQRDLGNTELINLPTPPPSAYYCEVCFENDAGDLSGEYGYCWPQDIKRIKNSFTQSEFAPVTEPDFSPSVPNPNRVTRYQRLLERRTMTKRPEVLDFIFRRGISFLGKEMQFPAIGDNAACNGMRQIFDQTIDFDDSDGEISCCTSVGKHSLHVSNVGSAAKAICGTCPLGQACATCASANDEFGVWGGTAKGERQRVAKTHLLSAERATRLSEEYIYPTNAPVRKICTRYNAVPRAVARWRSQLRTSKSTTN